MGRLRISTGIPGNTNLVQGLTVQGFREFVPVIGRRGKLANSDGWSGPDLFPYRDMPRKFIEVSMDNLRLAKEADLMSEKGARELRASGRHGPEMAGVVCDSLMKAK